MSTATGPVAWNAMVLDVHKELALEAGVIYAEYASHKAFLAASKEAGIVRADAMKEASKRKAAAAGKKAGVEERAERYRIAAEAEEAAGVPMREAPSTYGERAIHKIRLEMRGLPLIKAKSKAKPKAPKIPAPESESEAESEVEAEVPKPEVPKAKAEVPKAEVKAPKAEVPKAEVPKAAKPEVKAPKAEVKAPKPEVKAEDPHAESRRAFVAEGNEEVVIDGTTYYRMSTGECFTPGEVPYTIAEYVGIWDADLGDFVKDEY